MGKKTEYGKDPGIEDHGSLSRRHVKLDEYSLVSRHLIMPPDLNPNHSIFGGQLIAWLDKDLYVLASLKMRRQRMVTVSIERVTFKNPAWLGEIIEIYGAVKGFRRSSVTIHGKAQAIHPEGGHRLITECEITYVAIDETGKPEGVFSELLSDQNS